MSTLHERLLAATFRLHDHLVACSSCTTCEATSGYAALRAVVELHAPEVVPFYGNLVRTACSTCQERDDQADWPCSTIQAIARELGVDGEH